VSIELQSIHYGKYDLKHSYEWKVPENMESYKEKGWVEVTYGDVQSILSLWPIEEFAPAYQQETVTEGGLILMRRDKALTKQALVNDYSIARDQFFEALKRHAMPQVPIDCVQYLCLLFGINPVGRGYHKPFPKFVIVPDDAKDNQRIVDLNKHDLVEICWADQDDDVDLQSHHLVARLTIFGRAELLRACELAAHTSPKEG
jgi:hypothetical protein